MPAGGTDRLGRTGSADPAEHGPDPGRQLAGPGRLGDVVGRPRLEGQHGVELVVPGGDHDDRHRRHGGDAIGRPTAPVSRPAACPAGPATGPPTLTRAIPRPPSEAVTTSNPSTDRVAASESRDGASSSMIRMVGCPSGGSAGVLDFAEGQGHRRPGDSPEPGAGPRDHVPMWCQGGGTAAGGWPGALTPAPAVRERRRRPGAPDGNGPRTGSRYRRAGATAGRAVSTRCRSRLPSAPTLRRRR